MTFSLTKVAISAVEIEALVHAAFGSGVAVTASRPAQGGMYNAGYHLRLRGEAPPEVFLKVAPPDDVPCLTHERGLMRAEVDTLGKVAAAKVGHSPPLLATDFSRAVVDRDAVFMRHLPGDLLSDQIGNIPTDDLQTLRRDLAAIAGAIQRVHAPAFGYPHKASLQAATWPVAFGLMLTAVLDDAQRLDVKPSLEPLRPRLADLTPLLDIAGPPRLVHYDLWDGNVLVEPDEGGWAITGVIDWERAFYGDPLAEVVSLTFHSGMAPDAALTSGWASAAPEPLSLDAQAQRRLALYRVYLWLVMLVEAGPRGFLTTQPPAKWTAIRTRVERDLTFAEMGPA